MGNGDYVQFITSALCCSFLHTLLPRAGWIMPSQQGKYLPLWNYSSSSGFGLSFTLSHSFCSNSSLFMAFLSILKDVLSEAPLSAMPSGGSIGAIWNLIYPRWVAPISPRWDHPCCHLLPQLWELDPMHFNSVCLSWFHRGQDYLPLHYSCSITWFSILFCSVMYSNWKFTFNTILYTPTQQERREKAA